jgi:hypothetical protein
MYLYYYQLRSTTNYAVVVIYLLHHWNLLHFLPIFLFDGRQRLY